MPSRVLSALQCVNSFNHHADYAVDTLIILILQIKKLNLMEIK